MRTTMDAGCDGTSWEDVTATCKGLRWTRGIHCRRVMSSTQCYLKITGKYSGLDPTDDDPARDSVPLFVIC